MVDKTPFEPSSVTRPIQLLAAWLIGLILVNGSFLAGAKIIEEPEWAPGFLVICAASCVPIFLGALFLLQTKFRPEMQEDSFYHKYLEKKSAESGKLEYIPVRRFQRASGAPAPIRESLFYQNYPKDSVKVNDLLDNFEEIFEKLNEECIEIDDTFGSTSSKPTKPHTKVVSFGRDVDLGLAKKILSLSYNLGFAHISFTEEEYSRGDIYIGSYVFETQPDEMVSLTDDMYNSLMKARSYSRFCAIILKEK